MGAAVDSSEGDVSLYPALGRVLVALGEVEGGKAVLVVGRPARAQYWAIMPA